MASLHRCKSPNEDGIVSHTSVGLSFMTGNFFLSQLPPQPSALLQLFDRVIVFLHISNYFNRVDCSESRFALHN
jgi:hypothetical protein